MDNLDREFDRLMQICGEIDRLQKEAQQLGSALLAAINNPPPPVVERPRFVVVKGGLSVVQGGKA